MARIMSGAVRGSFDLAQAIAGIWYRFLDFTRTLRGKPSNAFLLHAMRNDNLVETGSWSASTRAQSDFSKATAHRRSVRAGSTQQITDHSSAWAELMARMSHDLRTPLNAVIGFSDVMSAELLGPVGHPRYREYAGDIRDCGQKLLKAAEDTLAMTALLAAPGPSATAHPLALGSLASEAWASCSVAASAGEVMLDVACNPRLEILGDARPMRQVFVNLMSEAIARAPFGGTVRIDAVREGDTVRIEIGVDNAVIPADAAMGSLPMSLAKALLELQGAGLLEIAGGEPSWCAVTILDAASQQDFFPIAETPTWTAVPAYC